MGKTMVHGGIIGLMASKLSWKNNYQDYVESKVKLEFYQKVGIIFLKTNTLSF